jgi:hypothetical protein
LKLLKKHLLGIFHINRNLGRRIGMSTLLGKQIFWNFSSIYIFFSDIYGFLNYDLRNWSIFIANIVFYLIFTCLNLIFCKQVWKLFVSIWGTLSIWKDDVTNLCKRSKRKQRWRTNLRHGRTWGPLLYVLFLVTAAMLIDARHHRTQFWN